MSAGDVLRLTAPAFEASANASPLLWLVNICWPACGFCHALEADWSRLARRLKHEAVVATYDVGSEAQLPAVLGEANVTPTIRAMVPQPALSTGGATTFKHVDYHGTRQFGDLLRFALGLMPSYTIRVPSVERFEELERQPSTPKLLCFLGIEPAVATPPLLRALSATFQHRILFLEVRVHESEPVGSAIAARYGVSALPSFMGLRASGEPEPWRHKGAPTFRRLREFAASLLAANGGNADPDALANRHDHQGQAATTFTSTADKVEL